MRKNPPLLGKKSYYTVRCEGEWFPLSSIDACCDCGLVHKNEYRVANRNTVTGVITIEHRSWRDNRRTAALRRSRKDILREKFK